MIFDESQGFQNTVQFEDSRSMFKILALSGNLD